MELFNTSPSSSVLIILTVIYAIAAAITTFDTRLIQAKRQNYLPADTPDTPTWTGLFGFVLWGLWVAIFLLNWWYALLLFVIKFILKLFPVLETIGAILLTPFIAKGLPMLVIQAHRNAYKQAGSAAKALSYLDDDSVPKSKEDLLKKTGRTTFLTSYWRKKKLPRNLRRSLSLY